MKKLENDIYESKELLFYYLNSTEDFQDLTKHFNALFKNSPEIYEILILIYQEFQTREKVNKKQISNLMNINVKVKEKLLDVLQELKGDVKYMQMDIDNNIRQETWGEKIKNNFTFKNVLKTVSLFILIISFLAIINHLYPEFFVVFEDIMNKFINSAKGA